MPKNNPNAYKNRNSGDGDQKKKKKRSRKVKPYDSFGTRKPTSTRRSSKRGYASERYAKNRAKGQAKAKANIARMMEESPSSMHNGYSAEDNKKVSKPEFKRKKKNK